MANYLSMDKNALTAEFDAVKREFDEIKGANLSLDMSRGKPGADQLDLSDDLLTLVNKDSGYKSQNGTDCRNYGGLDGLAEIKALFSKVLGMDYRALGRRVLEEFKEYVNSFDESNLEKVLMNMKGYEEADSKSQE